MRIMVVDDSLTMRKLHTNCLGAIGYEDIVWASNGTEALTLLDESIRLILLDWHMPGMSGLQFLERVKSHERYRGIPVIMVSSERSRGMIIKALKAGVKSYIIKPFAPELLQERILKALSPADQVGIKTEADEFQGSLKLMKVPEIIQFLSHGSKSGTLRIARGEEEYRLHFNDGQIANAEGPGRRDREVVDHVVKFEEGSFRFATADGDFEQRIGTKTSIILLDSLRKADEEGRDR